MPVNQGTGSAFASGYQPPEKYDLALMAGIRLFVLAYPKRCPDMNSRTLMGPFDVVVTENFAQGASNAAYSERWITGSDAGIKFDPIDKKGTLVAFMPDDRYYHNRLILADQPAIRVIEMQDQQNGIISASIVNMEIQCLRDIINENAPIYKIIKPTNNQEVDFFWSEAEAIDFINQEETVLRGPNQVPVSIQPYKKYRIEKGMKTRKRSDIMELITRYSREPYGWTASREFRNEIIPKVNTLIKSRREPEQETMSENAPFDMRKQILDVIRGLSPEEIDQIRNMKSEDDSEDVVDSKTELTKHTRDSLMKKKVGDVRTIAAEMGILVDSNATKVECISAILNAQNEPESSGESAMGYIPSIVQAPEVITG
jgi:hypothetical protein